MTRGIWLAFLLLAACSSGRSNQDPLERPNVVILLLDTVRADRLGCYEGRVVWTPRIDALARESLSFMDCSSVSAWTLPSHASLQLDASFPTLAELFGEAGYDSYGASANAVVGPANGLDRGFAHFEELYLPRVQGELVEAGRHAHAVALERWLENRDPERPYFAFLNFIEAHAPYRPRQPFFGAALPAGASAQEIERLGRTRNREHYLREGGLDQATLSALSTLYDGEIATLDWAVGQVVALLRERGELERTLLVITSDHGEAFGEHGHLAHSFSLYQELLHVPLILRLPGGARGGERSVQTVSLLDLFPTLLRVAHAPVPARIDGMDLLSRQPADRPIHAEYYYPAQVLSTYADQELADHAARFAPLMRRLRAARIGSRKLIMGSDGRAENYRLDRDPSELSPRAPDPQLLQLLQDYETRYAGPRPVPPTPPPGWRGAGFESTTQDPRLIEQLRALGYID